MPLTVYYIDTLDISQAVYGRRRKLKSLAQEFNIQHRVTHRAYDDAMVTAQVFVNFFERYGWETMHEFLKKWAGREY